MIKTINIIWHNAKEELPLESGKYLCVVLPNYIIDMSYSTIYKAFNIYDYSPYEYTQNIVEVDYWASLNFLEELK